MARKTSQIGTPKPSPERSGHRAEFLMVLLSPSSSTQVSRGLGLGTCIFHKRARPFQHPWQFEDLCIEEEGRISWSVGASSEDQAEVELTSAHPYLSHSSGQAPFPQGCHCHPEGQGCSPERGGFCSQSAFSVSWLRERSCPAGQQWPW